MKNIFSQIENTQPSFNIFDLSHDKKMSLDMGNLVPILCMDVIPGDSISLNTSQMLRFAPMVAPVMHKINIFTHFFFVPNRLVWSNWEDFITGGEDGTAEPVFPYIVTDAKTDLIGSLADYLGLPSNTGVNARQVSAIPFAAYQLIYNEYYRDQNLIDKMQYKLVDGDNFDIFEDITVLQKRAWQHDYFTSALPWTQKGPEATIPLGQTADIKLSENNADWISQRMKKQGGIPVVDLDLAVGNPAAFGDTGNNEQWFLDLQQSHYVDLSTATAASINDLRRAVKLQEWFEKSARGGSRYIEQIKSHFGVTSPDARLQRPEYLGGGSAPVTISEVLQTQGTPISESPTTTPQGTMAGHGISVGTSNNFSYRSTEHGYIIGIMSIMPRTAYFQGTPKHFLKRDKFDFYFPSFAHLGEQPITNEEIYTASTQSEREQTFGYTPRYAEYKFMPSTVHGDFKDSLDFWHMAMKFDNQPQLNADFIECVPDKRIFAVQLRDVQSVWAHVHHRIKAKRPMPIFSTPKF